MNIKSVLTGLSGAICVALITSWSVSGFAQGTVNGGGGVTSGGGGEPLANDFLAKADLIKSLLSFKDISEVDLDANSFETITKQIRASLDGQFPRLIFPEGNLVSCFGEPKVGCADTQGKISVARQGYIDLPPGEKYELVALEYLRILNVPNRYQLSHIIGEYISGKTEKIGPAFARDLEGLTFQVESILKLGTDISQKMTGTPAMKALQLAGTCRLLGQFEVAQQNYSARAIEFIHKTHPQETSFLATAKENGIIPDGFYNNGDFAIFCGAGSSLTDVSPTVWSGKVKPGRAEDFQRVTFSPMLNRLLIIQTNLKNY